MRKVAVFGTVGKAYGFLFGDIGLFIQQAWYWTLLIFAVQIAVVHSDISVWLANYIESGQFTLLENDIVVMLVAHQLRDIVSIFVLPATIVAYGIFSARWQRALLLHEEMPSGVPTLPGKSELKAVGAMAVFSLTFLLWKTLILGILAWPTALTGSVFFTVLAGLGWLLALVYLMRILLVVPAAVTGDDSVSISDAFAIGRGNSWRLFVIVLMCILPLFLVKLFSLTPDPYFMPGRASYSRGFNYPSWYAGVVIDFAALAIMQGGIAIAYRALVSDERREQLEAAISTRTDAKAGAGEKGRALAKIILLAAALAAASSMLT